jgi:hypothetical protein
MMFHIVEMFLLRQSHLVDGSRHDTTPGECPLLRISCSLFCPTKGDDNSPVFSLILIESNCEVDRIESDQEGLCMLLGLAVSRDEMPFISWSK